MPATKTVQYYTLQMLIDYAVRTRDDSSRWTISRWVDTARLEKCGTGSRFHGGTMIILTRGIADTILSAWRKNEWDTPVGALSLRRIIEIAGGPNTRAMVKAAQATAAKAEAERLERAALCYAAEAARKFLDALKGLGKNPAYVAAFSAGVETGRFLNGATHKDPGAAQMVAYDFFNQPRNDD